MGEEDKKVVEARDDAVVKGKVTRIHHKPKDADQVVSHRRVVLLVARLLPRHLAVSLTSERRSDQCWPFSWDSRFASQQTTVVGPRGVAAVTLSDQTLLGYCAPPQRLAPKGDARHHI